MAVTLNIKFTIDGVQAPADFTADLNGKWSGDSFLHPLLGVKAQTYTFPDASGILGDWILTATKTSNPNVDPASSSISFKVIDGTTIDGVFNFKTNSNMNLYLGIGVAGLAAYFMFFKKKSASSTIGG